jgi:hypothetical protein
MHLWPALVRRTVLSETVETFEMRLLPLRLERNERLTRFSTFVSDPILA